jgi:hypothetical protein
MSSKDELTKSISKSMTISDIQKELEASNINFSGAKKKADYVSLYVTNGLHNKEGRLSAIPEEEQVVVSIAKVAPEVVEMPVVVSVAKEEDIQSITVLEELIMSVTIMGHGCEDLMTPWPFETPISVYFKNNVRVYSKACVPDVNSIGNIYQNSDIIKDVQRRFSEVPKSATESIIQTYAKEVRDDYMRDIAYSKIKKEPVSLTPGFDKVSAIENLARVSNLSTFLCNKDFAFYMESPKERVQDVLKPVYKTIGIQVTDIRLKKTALDGSVSYEPIFNPSDIKYIRGDMTDYNLIYKSGVTFILKNILGRRDLVKPALEVLGFGKKDRVMDVSLEQIYNFFMLVGVKYTNIMDYTCRKCSVGHLSKSLTEQIYSVEQNFKKKPVAFGLKQSRRKHSNKRKQKTHKKYKK